jgi:GNAT superfamily N-acetyltransferase
MTLQRSVKQTKWEVRRLMPDDWVLFREIRLRALQDAPAAFGSTAEEAERRNEEEWRAIIAARAVFAAVASSGSTIGLAAGIVERPYEAELISMWVDPGWRGQGVADALVKAVEAWSEGHGIAALRLWVAEGNERAERFYSRLGFARSGKLQPMPVPRSERLEFEMVKALSPVTN